MSYTKPVRFTVVNTYGNHPQDEDDVYQVDTFRRYCESGMFIDYDGFGHPVRDSLADPDVWVEPSRLQLIPADATHVVWYNR